MYEIHVYNKGNSIYKDGKCEVFNINVGSGHGEDVIYFVEKEIISPCISFKYVLHSQYDKKYIRFIISIDEFIKCKLSPNIVFQHNKNSYIGDKKYSACIPTVFSNEHYDLISNLNIKEEIPIIKIEGNKIYKILKQIDM